MTCSNLLVFFIIDWFVVFWCVCVQQSEINRGCFFINGSYCWCWWKIIGGNKKIIDLKLSLYLLKQTIICKSYDVHRKVTSVLSLKTFYVYTDLPQNRFRTLTYSKWEVYSEPCHISTMKRWLVSRLIIFASYNAWGGRRPWIFDILIDIFKSWRI